LWCEEWDNRKTETQLGFGQPPDEPTELSNEEQEELERIWENEGNDIDF